MAAGYTVSVANQSGGNVTVALASATDTIDTVTNATEVISAKETRRYLVNATATGYVTSSSSSRKFGAIASGRNISAIRSSASTVDIDADELVLKDSSGKALIVTSVNLTLDITSSGANGLDTGSEAGDTWYYGWVIAQPGGTVAGLLSASATAPTLPSGYTFKALVTAARNDGSSNFIAYRQSGNETYYEAGQSVLTTGTATAETAVSCATFVPPIAHSILGHFRFRGNADGTGVTSTTCTIRVISGTNLFTSNLLLSGQSASGATEFGGMGYTKLPNVSQQFYYLFTNSSGSGNLTVLVLGFKLPLGGE